MKYLPFSIPCYALLPGILLTLLPFRAASQNTSLIIQPGTTFSLGNSTLVLDNTDIIANGTLDASDGNLVFTGANNSSVSFSSTPGIKMFRLNKPGNATVTLNSDITVTDVMDFQNGLLELNGNTVSLGGSGVLQNESETSRITGITGGGVIASATSVSNPGALNIGNLGTSITSSVNLGNVTVTRMHKPVQSPAGGNAGIQRTFLIQPDNNTALNATLRFYYFDAELNGEDESTLSLWSSEDGVNWTNAGFSTRNATDNYVETTGLLGLSYFTLADAETALPIVLSNFKVSCQNNTALLEWATTSEYSMAYFEAQRSTDGTDWTSLQKVTAADNTEGASYSCRDNSPQPGALYRLKLVDKSGNYSFSPVFTGDCSAAAMPFMVYPNPAPGNATARISVREASSTTVQIYNTAGQEMYSAAWNLQVGNNQLILPVQSLPAGIYIIKTLVNNTAYQAKLIKQ